MRAKRIELFKFCPQTCPRGEKADTQRLGRCVRKDVEVQILSGALKKFLPAGRQENKPM